MRSGSTTDCPEGRLAEVASHQFGVFSRPQARDAGISAGMLTRRVASGVWVKIHSGVFRMAGAPISWHQRLAAACLFAGQGAVISHLTAARLHGLEGIPSPRKGDPIVLTVPASRRLAAPGHTFYRSRRLERGDRMVIDGLPVTSLARTLVDLSAMLDEKRMAQALDSGFARYPNTTVRMLLREVRRLEAHGRKGPRMLERLLDERAPDAKTLDSALERRFRAALRGSPLPNPKEHFDVVEDGRHIAELDFAYPHARLGIQLQGAGVHRRYAKWERDQQQLSDLAAAGWRVIQITWAQLKADEPAALDRISRALNCFDPQAASNPR